MFEGATFVGYDPITSNQAVISSSFSGLSWFGDVVAVRIDANNGEIIFDEKLGRDRLAQISTRIMPRRIRKGQSSNHI